MKLKIAILICTLIASSINMCADNYKFDYAVINNKKVTTVSASNITAFLISASKATVIYKNETVVLTSKDGYEYKGYGESGVVIVSNKVNGVLNRITIGGIFNGENVMLVYNRIDNAMSDCDKAENNTISQPSHNQDGTIYKYGAWEIDKKKYIRNLGTNVQGYLENKYYQGWNEYFMQEFKTSYNKYMNALNDSQYPNRLYTNDFGSIIDTKGELGNDDEDDYWYDNKGNRITGKEYRALSERKKKKYKAFYANREIASYFNIVAKAIVDKDR